VIIDTAVHEELIDAAKSASPLEACGLLAGKGGRAVKFFPLTNTDESSEHYSMLPEEQFAAVRSMRAEGLQMLAIWHSHPETPARMSEEDLRLAYTPNVLYTITSLANPHQPATSSFEVTNGSATRVETTVDVPEAS